MRWFTVEEAAVYSRRHPETIRDALRLGTLRGSQSVKGGRWYTKAEWLDDWIMGVAA